MEQTNGKSQQENRPKVVLDPTRRWQNPQSHHRYIQEERGGQWQEQRIEGMYRSPGVNAESEKDYKETIQDLGRLETNRKEREGSERKRPSRNPAVGIDASSRHGPTESISSPPPLRGNKVNAYIMTTSRHVQPVQKLACRRSTDEAQGQQVLGREFRLCKSSNHQVIASPRSAGPE